MTYRYCGLGREDGRKVVVSERVGWDQLPEARKGIGMGMDERY